MNDKSLKVLEYFKIINKLIEECTSPLGKEYAQQLRPKLELEAVKGLQQETTEAQSLLIQRGSIPLSGIYDVQHLIRTTEIGSFLNPGQLLYIKQTIAVARKLKSFLKESDKEQCPYIAGLIEQLNIFKEIEDIIDRSVLNDQELSDRASVELKRIRKAIQNKNELVKNKLNSVINSTTNQKYLQDTIITIRQDRYVVPVKQEYRGNIPGLVHDQSSSGATLFIEPLAVVELNNQLKELLIQERIEIERILKEIASIIAEKGVLIKSNQSILQKIDFIFAKGKLSLKMKAVEPVVNNTKKIHIKNGRHPLIDQKDVVPTNIWLGKDFTTLVITGPNTGGKTVTLKTLGLLTLMAQSGLHIPADYGTKLSVFDHVFADIGDEQSIEQSLSTFSSHMTNIVSIIENVTDDSLVLFDELGAGTDPTEGAALAMAILNYLKDKNITVVATTHYSELKQYALTHEGVENASVEFDVKTLEPTYKLLIGVPGKSNAFEISQKLGLSIELIDSARRLLTSESIQFEELLQSIERNKQISEQERLESNRLKLEAEQQYEKYLAQKDKLEKTKDKIVRDAKQEAYKLIKEAKQEAEQIISNLRNLKLDYEEKEFNRQLETAKSKLNKKLKEHEHSEQIFNTPNTKVPKKLKSGETVKILSLNQTGYVIDPANKNNEVLVQVGIMKMNIPISDLQRDNSEKDIKKTGVGKILRTKNQIKSEVDVRGKDLEEALLEVDKYLDDVYIAGLNEVTIIHGVGTGILKAGIKQMLKSHKHIKAYREGKYGEGGHGVTVVEIK
ncbi:endonuclease MutS2 [Serpentinicella sp. ANB-PHB4]|uniref:endonuclease MutS2 n=1 Tax=Serpentinicella sp. ANB-PHB4 TaxID=3074076 RepID=UPI00285ADF9D|nr:endonuclease MutS2 [Serpentinicella sp. ANB-PHB4]MDR5659614.1 endonuclease MutS2 [Serpentinicella sp. ANB-PHB4]